MSQTLEIQVHYPLAEGDRIVLRTSQDWDRSIEADSCDLELGCRFVLTLPDALTQIYWKPCIDGPSGFRWSTGANYLVLLPRKEPAAVWPHYGDAAGELSDRFTVADPSGMVEHTVRVYLPPGYEENTLKRYPTLYMHDGHNVFLAEEAYLGTEWQADETMNLLDAMNVINKVIIVAVYPQDRMKDYTRLGCNSYGRYITRVLKPTIDARYRTLPGPEHAAVMGSSLGGVVSLNIVLRWPDVFGAAACLSSTFGFADDIAEQVQNKPLPPVRIYLDSGWPRDNFTVTREMAARLAARGMRLGEELLYFAFPLANHSEQHWAARLHLPFQFLFGKVWKQRGF